jgi:hypothetical protein
MVIIDQVRWQEKLEKRSGATVEGFDAPDCLVYNHSKNAVKRTSDVFRKLDFRTTKAFTFFIVRRLFTLAPYRRN